MTEYILLRARRDGAICDRDGNVIAHYLSLGPERQKALDITPAIVDFPKRSRSFDRFEDGYNTAIDDMEEARDGRA